MRRLPPRCGIASRTSTVDCRRASGVIDITPDNDPAQLLQTAETELTRLMEDNGALVLTDLFGATPSNIAARLASLPRVRVLAGANLPMLVRAVCYRSIPLDTLVDKALAGGIKGIQAVSPPAAGAANASCPASSTTCSTLAAAVSAAAVDTTGAASPLSCPPDHHAAT